MKEISTLGERREVLITEKNRKSYTGRDNTYNEIAVLGRVNLGESVEVEITGNSAACFVGVPLKS